MLELLALGILVAIPYFLLVGLAYRISKRFEELVQLERQKQDENRFWPQRVYRVLKNAYSEYPESRRAIKVIKAQLIPKKEG